MKRFIYLFLLVMVCQYVYGTNYHGEIQSFKQPDGTSVDVRLYGSEFYMRAEGLDGYTLVRDETTDWICYAKLSEDGSSLIATHLKYYGTQANQQTLKVIPGVPKHLDIKAKYIEEKMNANAKALFGLNTVEEVQQSYRNEQRAGEILQGHLKGLCIVIDFSDEVCNLDVSEYEDFCNNLNYAKFGNNGSVRNYFADISGGLLDYENVVFGIFRAPKTFKQYDAMPYAVGAQEILRLALNWIKSKGFDFSTLSINPDKTIQAINMMYMGNPPKWAQGMWFHQGYFSDFSSNGVKSGRYNTSPAKSPLQMGTVVHENGHMICKWPDTYKYNSDTGPDGIGAFDIMCGSGSETNPVLPNPYFMNRIGWSKDIDVTGKNTLLRDTTSQYSTYSYHNPNNSSEYYMFQSRQKKGRSQSIPDEGLIVWHINEKGDNQTVNHQVYVVHQNNKITNHAEALFRKGRLAEYNDESTPSSNWYDKSNSGLRLWDFSAPGDVMTYKIGAGPSLLVEYLGYQNDENGDGFLSAGESYDLVVRIKNIEPGQSTSAKVTCTVLGNNVGFVDILNPTVLPGLIESDSSVEVVFNVRNKASLGDFNKVEFKFEVEENARSEFDLGQVLIGKTYLMDTIGISDCGYNFLDPGGLKDYDNNANIVQTFYPTIAGHKISVEWLEFSVEESTGCKNDVLRVYNGPDITAPLMGKYCGSTLPKNIIADNSDGALTFQFKSSIAVTSPGWIAKVTCVPTSSTKVNTLMDATLFPNPTNGTTYINMNQPGNYQILITDVLGRKLMRMSMYNEQSVHFDTENLTKGIYFASIYKGNQVITKKFVVE